jgi:hypothetical protein
MDRIAMALLAIRGFGAARPPYAKPRSYRKRGFVRKPDTPLNPSARLARIVPGRIVRLVLAFSEATLTPTRRLDFLGEARRELRGRCF